MVSARTAVASKTCDQKSALGRTADAECRGKGLVFLGAQRTHEIRKLDCVPECPSVGPEADGRVAMSGKHGQTAPNAAMASASNIQREQLVKRRL